MESTRNRRKESGLLRRTNDGRVLGGVASGLAEHLGLDATYVRAAAVGLALLGGSGVLLYLAAWALIPEKGSDFAIADGILRHG